MPITIAAHQKPSGSIFEYRDLIYLLVRLEFVSKVKQTALGPVWLLLQPMLMAGVFVGVFTKIVHLPSEGASPILFYLSGLLVWGYFSQSLASVATSLTTYASLLRKIYFPRLVLPLSVILAKLIPFFLQLSVFLVLFAALDYRKTGAFLYLAAALPLVLTQAAAASLGAGLWLASFSIRYRDLQHALSFFLQLGMYLSPVVYSPAQVPEVYRPLIFLNPIAGPIGLFRRALFGTPIAPIHLALSLAVSMLLLTSGLYCFSRIQAKFIDTI